MITHRVETRHPAEPSVRFYRTIAISFLLLTVVLLGVVIFVTSKKADIIITAKEDSKSINLSIEAGKEKIAGKAIVGTLASDQFVWSEKYFPTGNKTADDVATGEVIIYNKTAASQPLVKTTRLLTASGILFRLSERVEVPAAGQVTAKVYSDQKGASFDIGPSQFTIPGLNIEKQKLIYAESLKPMTGGTRQVGVLSESDLKSAQDGFAEKMKEAYLAAKAKNDPAGMKRIALAVDGGTSVNKAAGDEVSEFTVSGSSTMVSVLYNPADLNELINKEMGQKIDADAEKILSVSKEPQVAIVSYDLSAGTAQLSVRQDINVTIDANAAKLSVLNFLGKKKDEIQRYVLGLDHVAGVEVKFTPSWMRTAPGVPDKIKVMVKNVK